MRKFALVFALLLSCCGEVYSQQSDHRMNMGSDKPVSLMSGLGSLHHPVSTKDEEAQRFFDQGLRMIYGFNHAEAIRSFQRAAELDPNLAMAYWGIALALGPNINQDVDADHEKTAYDAEQKALSFIAKAPANERAYIEALAKRYSNDPKADLKKLAVDYKNAMGELVKNFPDDLDAATLYAESAMDLRPWQLWTADGKPADGTEEIVAVLESVLHRNPNHPGAIHYYIHAVEASPHPERALAYASRLGKLMPAAGHLVHMPGHIYERVGDYESAARSNIDAAAADEAYFKKSGRRGFYAAMYYSHNLHFLAVARSMQGRFGESIKAARRREADFAPAAKEMPMLESYLTVPALILVHFGRWNEIDSLPQPDPSLKSTIAIWHFARGMSLATKGDVEKARVEYEALVEAQKAVPADALSAAGLNPATKILAIADDVLNARIATARKDNLAAIRLLRQGVEKEDSLSYEEPASWCLPVRESLGGALMQSGDFAGAEQVFRADLQRNRRNGRSLFGLVESLKRQKKDYASAQTEFRQAWKNADVKLTVQDLWR
jgi:tetratricopeptide (TPR) repeat protein